MSLAFIASLFSVTTEDDYSKQICLWLLLPVYSVSLKRMIIRNKSVFLLNVLLVLKELIFIFLFGPLKK